MDLNKLLNPVVEDSIMVDAPPSVSAVGTRTAGQLLDRYERASGMDHNQVTPTDSAVRSTAAVDRVTPMIPAPQPPATVVDPVFNHSRPAVPTRPTPTAHKANSDRVSKQSTRKKTSEKKPATANAAKAVKTRPTAPPDSAVVFDHSEIYSGRTRVVPAELRELAEQHSLFAVRTKDNKPGQIRDHTFEVRYKSEKPGGKVLKELGTTSLKVFEYEFMYNAADPWPMAWDYRNGLTRITALLIATGYSKTAPRIVLAAMDPNFLDYCLQTTGGIVGSQGFWVPHDIAKMIAAIYCWEIRYALTPVFGDDFPATCLMPDHPNYQKNVFDQQVVAKAKAWLAGEKARAAGGAPAARDPSTGGSSATPADSQEEAVTTVTVSHAGLDEKAVFARLSTAGQRSGRLLVLKTGAAVVRSVTPEPSRDAEETVRTKKEVHVYRDPSGRLFFPVSWGMLGSEELETILVRIAEEDEDRARASDALRQLQRDDAELAGRRV